MPSRKVVEALIRLMRAKEVNTAREAARATTPSTATSALDDAGARNAVQRARQQARDVQGVDPLAAKAAKVDEPRQKVFQLQQFIDDAYGVEGMATRNQKGFNSADAITRGTGTTAVTRHGDPFGGPNYSQKTVLDDIEGAAPNTAYPKLIEEFQALFGRPPTPDEMNNRPLMERLVGSMRGPNKAATPDDIPF